MDEPKGEKAKKEEFTELDPLKSDQNAIEEPKKSFKDKAVDVFRNITVEPVILMFVFPAILTMLTTQNLSLEKACRVNLNLTSEICDSLKIQNVTGPNEHEAMVQKLAAKAMSMRNILSATIPSLLGLFVGSWSDRSGRRKIFLIIPIFGQILVIINNFLNVFFFYELNLNVLIFSEAAIDSLTGSWCVVFLSAFSYVSAITSVESRTYRIGLTNFCMTIGFPIGMGLSGVLIKNFGYYGSYGVAGCAHFLNLLYLIFVLRDPPRTKDQIENDSKNFFRSFFDLTNLRETVRVVFKKGPNRRRLRMCLLLAIVSILFGPMYGEISVMYMSTRYRFNWDEVNFSIFQSYNFLTHTTGTIFSIMVLSKHLKFHDALLGIISTTSKIAGSFVYCFAPNEKIFFLAPLVDILNGTSLLVMRSIISKLVNIDELGKVNSIFNLTENLMPLLYVPLYTRVYTATMDVLPGFVFLMGAMMTVPAVIVFSWLLHEHRKEVRKSKRSGTNLKELN